MTIDDHEFPARLHDYRKWVHEQKILSSHYAWEVVGLKIDQYSMDETMLVVKWRGWSPCCGVETDVTYTPMDKVEEGDFSHTKIMRNYYTVKERTKEENSLLQL